MQSAFITGFPKEKLEEVKSAVERAPGYISVQDIDENASSILTMFCHVKEGMLGDFASFLKGQPTWGPSMIIRPAKKI